MTERRMDGDGALNLPYEGAGGEPIEIDMANVRISGGLVVRGAVADVPGAGPMPALVFNFHAPNGQAFPPISLVVEDVETFAAAHLIKQAANSAVRAAKERRRERGLE